ncbi:uncharacterized protein LOC126851891 [Cataglyphis hispanica]|uniref:uncharacterized protein LOC126851891 n=1 Tax=Cataglyphis hispanica TaxID=1086592 RepID=UPI00217F7CE7|nr:uncharacterized protein LOC126851891 [Cataglyphis hispanica]
MTSSLSADHSSSTLSCRLRAARLRLNSEKCQFCVDQLKYLGHVVDRVGIYTDPKKVSALTSWTEPRLVKQICQFLGMASWYCRFIENFSTLAAPLTHLTKKNARSTWRENEAAAFKQLKNALTTAPVLACPSTAASSCKPTRVPAASEPHI